MKNRERGGGREQNANNERKSQTRQQKKRQGARAKTTLSVALYKGHGKGRDCRCCCRRCTREAKRMGREITIVIANAIARSRTYAFIRCAQPSERLFSLSLALRLHGCGHDKFYDGMRSLYLLGALYLSLFFFLLFFSSKID